MASAALHLKRPPNRSPSKRPLGRSPPRTPRAHDPSVRVPSRRGDFLSEGAVMQRPVCALTIVATALVCMGVLTQAHAAVVTGTDEPDRLDGTRFSDRIRGRLGNDTIHG